MEREREGERGRERDQRRQQEMVVGEEGDRDTLPHYAQTLHNLPIGQEGTEKEGMRKRGRIGGRVEGCEE